MLTWKTFSSVDVHEPQDSNTKCLAHPQLMFLQSKSRGDESPTTVEEMHAKLEREMAATHEEQKR